MPLPVSHLSASSLRLYAECPTRWRRRYVEREYESPSPAMVLGSAIHAAVAYAHREQMASERPAPSEVADCFAAEWDERSEREPVEWGGERKDALTDWGAAGTTLYEAEFGARAEPVAVEREIDVRFADVDWSLTGYIDREDADGTVKDLKVSKRRMSDTEAATSLQAGVYALARRAEGNPAPSIDYEGLVRLKAPVTHRVSTARSDAQLDALVARIYDTAAEIEWRVQTGNWSYAAPGAWTCNTCGYQDCPFHPRPRRNSRSTAKRDCD